MRALTDRDARILAIVTAAFAAWQQGEAFDAGLTVAEWERGEDLLSKEGALNAELATLETRLAQSSLALDSPIAACCD